MVYLQWHGTVEIGTKKVRPMLSSVKTNAVDDDNLPFYPWRGQQAWLATHYLGINKVLSAI